MWVRFGRALKKLVSGVWEHSPSDSDRIRTLLQAFGLVMSFLTLLVALLIGFLQYRINQSLLDLTYMPAIALTYDQNQHRLNIANQGKANLFLCGTRTSYDKGVSFDSPRLIAPGSFYQIRSDQLERTVLQTVGKSGTAWVSLELYFEDSGGDRWEVDNLIHTVISNGVFTADTQTLSIARVAWLRLGRISVISSSRMPKLARIRDLIWPLPIGPALVAGILLAYIIRVKTKRRPPGTGPNAPRKPIDSDPPGGADIAS